MTVILFLLRRNSVLSFEWDLSTWPPNVRHQYVRTPSLTSHAGSRQTPSLVSFPIRTVGILWYIQIL